MQGKEGHELFRGLPLDRFSASYGKLRSATTPKISIQQNPDGALPIPQLTLTTQTPLFLSLPICLHVLDVRARMLWNNPEQRCNHPLAMVACK